MSDTSKNITQVDFSHAISERYLSYALSTIMSRSLPDVRDGLKPVHRRIIYAMMKLKLDPKSGYKKCARIIGDVIGKYHPHGDTAVYETLVRLAQNFSLRYPLIDGQGNFGSIDGDNAAAMRYTESKMTDICTLLIRDIDQNTVDFRSTYDGSDSEPILMPSVFPNLLANGSEGIAVGMATSIPPHNLHELCDALMYLIDHQDKATSDDLMEFIQGPDLPCGGVIIENINCIKQYYSSGKGSFKIRAKWKQESLKNGLYQIVITEIPYQIQKSKVIEQIASLIHNKKLPLIDNIRDESTEDIRIVIEIKNKTYTPEIIMASIFQLTSLESRISLNMNVLSSKGAPKVMGILEVLYEFIMHRKTVALKRSTYQISKINTRLEVLEALKIVYLNIDEVIKVIREEDNPKHHLMINFKINDNQAEAILNLRLRLLRKLEEQAINQELKDLLHKRSMLNDIINNPQCLWESIKSEVLEVQKNFGNESINGKRKTVIQEPSTNSSNISIRTFIEKEPLTIICSTMGWIRSLKGHNIDPSSIKYKEGDSEAFILEVYTTDVLLLCTTEGKLFNIFADNIIRNKKHGEAIKLIIDIGNHIIINILVYQENTKLLLTSSDGKGFIINSNQLIASTKNGKHIMNVQGDTQCLFFTEVIGDMIAIVGTNRKLLIFRVEEIPIMKRGKGVTLHKYRNAKVSDIKLFDSQYGLTWDLGLKTRREKDIRQWQSKRGGVGKIPPVGFPKNNKFSCSINSV